MILKTLDFSLLSEFSVGATKTFFIRARMVGVFARSCKLVEEQWSSLARSLIVSEKVQSDGRTSYRPISPISPAVLVSQRP